MPVPTVTDQAICVRVWDWSETSQTVSVFGRETGMVRAVAKGAKRENAKFSGGLEVPTRGEMVVSLKAGETLSLLTAWDLQELFPGVRRTLGGFYAGMCAVELVSHALTEQDPHPRLFDGLLAALRAVGSADGDRVAVLGLLWLVLDETGHRPELEMDVLTGAVVEPATTYGFVPSRGGITVDPRVGPSVRKPVWRVRGETVELLRRLAAGSGGGGMGNGSASDAAVERALRLLLLYYSETFHARPSGVEAFLAGGQGAQVGGSD